MLMLCLCALSFMSVFIMPGCTGSDTLRKTSYVQSDVAAIWGLVGVGRERGIQHNSLGSLTIDTAGTVKDGMVHEYGLDNKKLIGGQVLVSEQGFLSGSIDVYLADSDTQDQYTIIGGQLSARKDIALLTGRFPTGRRGLILFISSHQTLTQEKLAGQWVVLHNKVYTLEVDREGVVTDCRAVSEGADGPETCEGEISLSAAGSVAAGMIFSDAAKAAIAVKGYVNAGNGFVGLVGSDSTNFEGITLPFLRREGTFSGIDLEGIWRFFMTGANETLFGTLRVDKAGNVPGGTWSHIGAVKVETGSLAGGSLSLTDQGGISGSITTSSGNIYHIPGGQMASQKDIAGAIYLDGSRRKGVLFLVRMLPEG